MGRQIEPKTVRRPKTRARSSGGRLFSGEVVRLLHLERLSYPQLRALARIVRGEEPQEGRWSCFAFRDLVAIRAAIKLAGDKANPYGGQRLMLREVERACAMLRERYKIAAPLTTVRLEWHGGRIVAQFEGVHFEPASQQLLLAPAAINAVVRRIPKDDRAALKQALTGASTSTQRPRSACGGSRTRGKLPLEE